MHSAAFSYSVISKITWLTSPLTTYYSVLVSLCTVGSPLTILVTFPVPDCFNFCEEAGKACKWINKCSNTKCLITVLTLNYHGKLLATSVWGVTHRGAETRFLSNEHACCHTACQLWFNSVPGVSLRADLGPWINYLFNAHKPRSNFFVCHTR